MDPKRICRSCGISDIFTGLIDDKGEPWVWQDKDLCSVCADADAENQARDAARYRFLRSRKTTDANLDAGRVFAGRPGAGVVLAGEDLDRAIDAEMADAEAKGEGLPETLERRLAQCLADIVDKPILSGRDELGAYTSPLEIRLGFFHPELANRAAELLEEAGL